MTKASVPSAGLIYSVSGFIAGSFQNQIHVERRLSAWQAAYVSAFCRAVDTVRARQTAGGDAQKTSVRERPGRRLLSRNARKNHASQRKAYFCAVTLVSMFTTWTRRFASASGWLGSFSLLLP